MPRKDLRGLLLLVIWTLLLLWQPEVPEDGAESVRSGRHWERKASVTGNGSENGLAHVQTHGTPTNRGELK